MYSTAIHIDCVLFSEWVDRVSGQNILGRVRAFGCWKWGKRCYGLLPHLEVGDSQDGGTILQKNIFQFCHFFSWMISVSDGKDLRVILLQF